MLRRELSLALLLIVPVALAGCSEPAHLQASASGTVGVEAPPEPSSPPPVHAEWTNFTRTYALATSPGLLLMDKGDAPAVPLVGNESVRVEMAWDATSLTARELVLVVSVDGRDVANVRGASPLAWAADGPLEGNLTARPALPAGSVVVHQEVRLAVMTQRP